ncbi:hypothetical protein pgond44_11336 [Psychroflexus gondwanensis ACAM 44]|uniref:Uncharacterized protein n=1 Tax=Psychroflexus gondwanensis ACAM 44 TaxID=1189619 RepID=N1WTW6_9FLAO|nr:hypothetical protein pgond44_11336 [Psychroflexus gondwanensis ACAM 44]
MVGSWYGYYWLIYRSKGFKGMTPTRPGNLRLSPFFVITLLSVTFENPTPGKRVIKKVINAYTDMRLHLYLSFFKN